MGGNKRNFGALDFRRLLKHHILGGGNNIPLSPSVSTKLADDASEQTEPVFDEPILTRNITDELWTKEDEESEILITENPSNEVDDFVTDEIFTDKIITDEIVTDEIVTDEISTDVKMHIVAEQGLIHFAGFLGKGSKKM